MTQPIIDIRDLCVEYRQGRGAAVRAVDHVDLAVLPGEVFGLLGPNGAGKTSLLSCLEGLVRPQSGSVMIDGLEVATHSEATKRKLGIQLQRSALLDDLTAIELVRLYAALYEVRLSEVEAMALLAQFDLTDVARRYTRRLSGGQQQRLALAIALANRPEILLLDEPTSALDPRARREVWAMIRRAHAGGRTVVITTHLMQEAEALCDRVAIIDRGRVVALGTPAELVAAFSGGSLDDVFLAVTEA